MKQTVLFPEHLAQGGRMVEFAGWQMPLHYPTGILEEHLLTRAGAGLFDTSHMGRFLLRGPGALALLQRVLSNDAASLEPGRAHYTLLPSPAGGAVDDAFLYRFEADEHLLVVNASNREKDLEHIRAQGAGLGGWELFDLTEALAMLSLQGPRSEEILARLLRERGAEGALPPPRRNALATLRLGPVPLRVSRTGYTGEPLGFELILPSGEAAPLWRALLAAGAAPVGLGARDSLRLEAGLPLYGHELGPDPGGSAGYGGGGDEIPVFAIPQARFAVRAEAPGKEGLVGREALLRQARAHRLLRAGDPAGHVDLPRWVRPVALSGKGIGRAGDPLLADGRIVGRLTSGTVVPHWSSAEAQRGEWESRRERLAREGGPAAARSPGATGRRAIGLALLDSRLGEDRPLEAEVRGGRATARLVPGFLDADVLDAGPGPFTRPRLLEGG